MKKFLTLIVALLISVVAVAETPNVKTDAVITHVTLTVYQPVTTQCNSNPLVTADMSKIDLAKLEKGEIKWCAISRDLKWLFKFGDKIYIEGFGVYEVHDVMNKRYDHYIDILIHPSDKTRFKKSNIKVTKISK